MPPAAFDAPLPFGAGPVRVDVYVDYQCPPCSAFEAATADEGPKSWTRWPP